VAAVLVCGGTHTGGRSLVDPQAQDNGDELTDDQVDQVVGGLAKIGVGVTIL